MTAPEATGVPEDVLLRRRFGDERPGLELLAVEDAAIPVTRLKVTVLAQQRKALPILDEFVLRLVQLGQRTSAEISGVLGLPAVQIQDCLAKLVTGDFLTYRPDRGQFDLTQKGLNAVRDLYSVQPVETEIVVTFDRTIWRIAADYSREWLMKKAEAESAGRILLPASRTKQIGGDEITAAVLTRMLARSNVRDRQFDVLAIRSIVTSGHFYLPAHLLIYASDTHEQVAVVLDRELSDPHEFELAHMGGTGKLGIHIDRARSAVPDRGEEQGAESHVAPPSEGGVAPVPPVLIRNVSVFEHRELLWDALNSSHRRLLIISPWMKSAVVNDDFVHHLQRLLRQGVQAYIAYGIGHDDSQSDARAIARLEVVREKYPQVFSLVRHPNTHAKVLISDDRIVTTSFNWLSFKGDPNRTYRMEEGTLVESPDFVDQRYREYVEELTGQPPSEPDGALGAIAPAAHQEESEFTLLQQSLSRVAKTPLLSSSGYHKLFVAVAAELTADDFGTVPCVRRIRDDCRAGGVTVSRRDIEDILRVLGKHPDAERNAPNAQNVADIWTRTVLVRAHEKRVVLSGPQREFIRGWLAGDGGSAEANGSG